MVSDHNEPLLMGGDRRSLLRRYSIAAFSCLALALACILVLGIWGALRDVRHRRVLLFRSEIAEVTSHAVRTIRYVEGLLAQGQARPDLTDLPVIGHWQRTILVEDKWTHAAIENPRGTIIAHSNPVLVGQRLTGSWYDRVVPLEGSDIVETSFPGLTEGHAAYDVRLPIMFNGKSVGTYHSGLSVHWFDRSAAAERQHALIGWGVVLGGTMLVMLLGLGSLYLITRQAAALQHRLDLADLRRVSELSQFIGGMAHEVRNPLNVIRMNLHAIGRVIAGEAQLPAKEVEASIRESVREIGRVAALIHEMLGYAHDEAPCVENVDLGAEVNGTLKLVKQVMEDHHIAVVARLPAEPLWIQIDRSRLRQILLNLLNNSREAVGKGGRIEIGVARARGMLELVVSDNGPGVPAAQRQRIFEPFYSTKDVGTGLGLALVKKFVDESGGNIAYEPGQDAGGRFLVRLPEAPMLVDSEVAT